MYLETGRLKEAEPLLERTLTILVEFTRQTGYLHPHLEITIENYTGLLMEIGKSEEDVATRLSEMGAI